MSNASNRTKGKVEELTGKAKASFGKAIGNQQMQAEGRFRAVKGKAKQELAKGSERARGKVEEVSGSVKKRVGALIDNQQMQAAGTLKELQGAARREANK
jgi:uncharacterized protein YjbJ (UPF0337 family)